tara:strand:+ start:44 stop:409 length:366 start_codon:yes stop_codon:yes gene_type:complete
MEQEEVLYVKTLGNQTGEIVLGLRKEDPDINIRIVYESPESVCFVLNKSSEEKIDIEGLCDSILKEDPIHYRTYWQVNVGTRKPNIDVTPVKTHPTLPNKIQNPKKNTTKSDTPSLAWRFL